MKILQISFHLELKQKDVKVNKFPVKWKFKFSSRSIPRFSFYGKLSDLQCWCL